METELVVIGTNHSLVENSFLTIGSRLDSLHEIVPSTLSVRSNLAAIEEPLALLESINNRRYNRLKADAGITLRIETLIRGIIVILREVGELLATDLNLLVELIALWSNDVRISVGLHRTGRIRILENQAVIVAILSSLCQRISTRKKRVRAGSHELLHILNLLEVGCPVLISLHREHEDAITMLQTLKNDRVRSTLEYAELEVATETSTSLTVVIILRISKVVEQLIISIERDNDTHRLVDSEVSQ